MDHEFVVFFMLFIIQMERIESRGGYAVQITISPWLNGGG